MEPNTLQAATLYFASFYNCREYLVAHRWPDGVTCPRCGSKNVLFQSKYNRWQCGSRHALRQFTSKTGTIFEDSPLGLDKWLLAMWQVVNCKNGVSSYEIAKAIGVTQKSAWFMLHRIRVAMGDTDGKIDGNGPVEIDETFVGGKVKNMQKSRRVSLPYQGGAGKAIVLGMLERGGQVRAGMVESRLRKAIQPPIHKNVEAGSYIITDEFSTYPYVAKDTYMHDVINHIEGYVRGHVHTNGIENFWSLLKRGLTGTYVSVEPFHLDAYVAEQVFRYNNRHKSKNTDATFGVGDRLKLIPGDCDRKSTRLNSS